MKSQHLYKGNFLLISESNGGCTQNYNQNQPLLFNIQQTTSRTKTFVSGQHNEFLSLHVKLKRANE